MIEVLGAMGLKESIAQDLKDAMLLRDRTRVSTLRLLIAAVKNAEIDKRGELSEDELIDVINREVRKRREAIAEFEKGNRPDLVEKEEKELEILKGYLPEQLPVEELRKMIGELIKEMGASSAKDLGRLMSRIMPAVKGRANGKIVNQLAREMLETD